MDGDDERLDAWALGMVCGLARVQDSRREVYPAILWPFVQQALERIEARKLKAHSLVIQRARKYLRESRPKREHAKQIYDVAIWTSPIRYPRNGLTFTRATKARAVCEAERLIKVAREAAPREPLRAEVRSRPCDQAFNLKRFGRQPLVWEYPKCKTAKRKR